MEKEDFPRERLLSKGSEALSNSELFAIILGSGSKFFDVFSISRELSNIGLESLSKMNISELQKIKGLGFAKSCKIISVFELLKRFDVSKNRKRIIRDPHTVYKQFSFSLGLLDVEKFVILHLDTKNRILKEETVSLGTLNESLVHPREVFRSAIRENVNSIILMHNHPSGDPCPSEEDKILTKRLVSAGKLLNIKILDHIIIGKESFYSFTEEREFFV